MIFTLPLDQQDTLRVVYSITTTNPYFCAYVGECPMSGFARLEDALRNPEVVATLKNPQFIEAGPVVTMLHICTSAEDAFNKRERTKLSLLPRYEWFSESRGKQKRGRKTRPIMCVETGQEFDSATDACREYDIAPSNMSNHLSGVLKKVRGYTFRYVD